MKTKVIFLFILFFLTFNNIYSQPSYFSTNKALDVKLCEWRCSSGFDYNGYNKGTLETDDIYKISSKEYKVTGIFKWDGFWGSNYKGEFEAWIILHGSGKISVNKICITNYGDDRTKEYCKTFYSN